MRDSADLVVRYPRTAVAVGLLATLLVLVPNPETGVAGDLSKQNNLGGYIDRTYLPGRIMKAYYEFGDNEGILSTIPAVQSSTFQKARGSRGFGHENTSSCDTM